MTADEQHLDLLAIFHYVVAGITALVACFPMIHLGVGIAMLLGAFDRQNGPPAFFGWIFVAVASVMILLGWTLAAFIFATGRNLKRRTAYTFCLVMAGVECIFMPFGTVLGVFTIVVLIRDSVKRLFSQPS